MSTRLVGAAELGEAHPIVVDSVVAPAQASGVSSPARGSSSAAAGYRRRAQAANTRIAYRKDWAAWAAWCAAVGACAMPADPVVVADYVAERAQAVDEQGLPVYAPATLSRWVAAINDRHAACGLATPGSAHVVRQTLSGIRRERADRATRSRGSGRARPLLLADLKKTLRAIDVSTWPAGVAGRRDVAMLLIGWAGALRRSEIAALDVGDIIWHPTDGLIIEIAASKTDQDGVGQRVGIPRGRHVMTCGPCALIHWVPLLATVGDERPRVAAMIAMRRSKELNGHVCMTPPAEASDAGTATGADGGVAAGGIPADGITLAQAYRLTGSVFRTVTKASTIGDRVSGDAVGKVVSRRTRAAGLAGQWSAHSLRVGLVTEASRRGASVESIQRQTRHRSAAMVAAYTRHENVLDNNAVTVVGL